MPQAFISVGSNIDRELHVRNALDALADKFGELVISPVYESVAVGFTGDSFYNLVVAFETTLSVGALVRCLKDIEVANKRQKGGAKFGSRTLDLDVLLYDELVGAIEGVKLPRFEINKYAFVLRPLQDIAPLQKHPVLDVSYQQLWQQVQLDEKAQTEKQELWPVDFDWHGQTISRAE